MPTLLLVNGLGGTVVTYAHLLRRCRAFFRVVCVDTRGLHGSGRPVGGPTSREVPFHAEDVIAVADGVGVDAGTQFAAIGLPDEFQRVVIASGVMSALTVSTRVRDAILATVRLSSCPTTPDRDFL